MHGLRHAYAQNRYEELTGWQCPSVGGPDSKVLTPEQRAADREARLTISQELGMRGKPWSVPTLGGEVQFVGVRLPYETPHPE